MHRHSAPLYLRLTALACALTLVQTQLHAQAEGAIVVPAGTSIPATLNTAVHTRKTKVGATIRATVAFPVTVGDRLAIPVGTVVEGTLEAVPPTKKDKHPLPALHFTRLVFADGSTASLDGSLQTASLRTPPAAAAPSPALAQNDAAFVPTGHGGGSAFPFDMQAVGAAPRASDPSTTNPFAHSGPNPFVIIGPTLAVFGLLVFLLVHKSTHADSVRYDTGYQFQLVLNAPLTLDSAHVNASAALPAH